MDEALKAYSARLPAALAERARRHADLYHSSFSQLVREALEYRLSQKTWPPAESTPFAPQDSQAARLLGELALHMRRVLEEIGTEEQTKSYGHTDVKHEAYDGHTNETMGAEGEVTTASYGITEKTETSANLTPPLIGLEETAATPVAYDSMTSLPANTVLGKLCPRGHAYEDTGRSLLRLPSRVCRECDKENKRAYRARRR